MGFALRFAAAGLIALAIVAPASAEETPTARKLIRPSLAEVKDRYPTRSFQRKQAPPEQTNAENYYYLKQMGAKTPMVVMLNDGEEIHGWIEARKTAA